MHILLREEPSVNDGTPVTLVFEREGVLFRLRIHTTGGCIDRSFDAGLSWEPVAICDPDYAATLQAARPPGLRPPPLQSMYVRCVRPTPAWQQTYKASLGPEPAPAVEGRR